MQKLRSIILILLISNCFADDPKPNQVQYSHTPNVDAINVHLQDNYKLILNKKLNLILTGQYVKVSEIVIDTKTFTTFKIEF
jgi:flagellar basal body P-ring protein FlgI